MLPPSTFTNDYVYTDKSTIHGLGLFAKIDLSSGHKICDYIGEKLTFKDFYLKYDKDYNYTYRSLRTQSLLCAKEEPYLTNNPCNYCNESKDPNVVLKKWGLYTTKDVVAGEELFLNYGRLYNRDYVI